MSYGPLLLIALSPLLAPDVQPDAPQICAGETVTLDAGADWMSYDWSTGETTRLIHVSPSSTSTYSVVVRDFANGSGSASETVTVNPVPAVAIASSPDTLCFDPANWTIVDLEVPPDFLTYSWSCSDGVMTTPDRAQTWLSLAPAFAGSVDCQVLVTDANGCAGSSGVQLQVLSGPWVDAGPDVVTCHGSPAALQAQAMNAVGWSWSPAYGLDSTDGSQPNANPDVTTTYTVTVADYNGCTASDQVTVTVLEAGEPAELANSLRLTRSPTGSAVYQSWTDEAGVAVYELSESLDAGTGYWTLMGEAGPGQQTMLEDNQFHTVGVRYQRLLGYACR